MDIRMPVMDGLQAPRRIVADGGAAHVLVLTTFDLDEYVLEVANRRGAPATTSRALRQLTEREQDVLRLIAQGLSNGEICDELVVSAATVKTHISHLLQKLDARDRAQLIVIAYTSGFRA